MSIIAWIVLGLIAGFIASKLVNKSGEGMLMDIILGVVGSVVGGSTCSACRASPGSMCTVSSSPSSAPLCSWSFIMR